MLGTSRNDSALFDIGMTMRVMLGAGWMELGFYTDYGWAFTWVSRRMELYRFAFPGIINWLSYKIWPHAEGDRYDPAKPSYNQNREQLDHLVWPKLDNVCWVYEGSKC